MNPPPFLSPLAASLDEFVAFKRSQGHDYAARAATLCRLDRFLLRSGHAGPGLSADILGRYAAPMAGLEPGTVRTRLAAARVFSRWLRLLVPGSAVVEPAGARRPAPPWHYLYSAADLAALLQAARQTGARDGSIRPSCLATLLGLLHATGLRIGEALALNLGDVDPALGRLAVRRGKLGKARNVALGASAAAALGRYLDVRGGFPPGGPAAPLFINTRGRRLGYGRMSAEFRGLVKRCGVGAGAARPPRLHDLRHSFACGCLRKWYEEGADVNAKLPILATALGHVDIASAQLYLHATAQLLQTAAGRFHNTFNANSQGASK